MDLPCFLVYIKESYENMKMLFPEEHGTDRYRVLVGVLFLQLNTKL